MNSDDEAVRRLEISKETGILWYGVKQQPASGKWLQARDIESTFSSVRFIAATQDLEFAVESPLVGHINVYNILLACGAALTLGCERRAHSEGIERNAESSGEI